MMTDTLLSLASHRKGVRLCLTSRLEQANRARKLGAS